MSAAAAVARTRHRIQKGRPPVAGGDPRIDTLLNMVMALTSEVAVLRERLDAHERLAASNQFTGPDAVDAYQPDEAVQKLRAGQRERLIAKVCRPLVAEGVTAAAADPVADDA
ncbi:MAG TPA: hypothetical protein P5528_01520 [Steroidobacteraceae bacterium]|nr:hypothetical protein [Steroidobacteraceae bacterium]HRX88098.1 hypothetical protein [Steroidobacteraceae bacterium]